MRFGSRDLHKAASGFRFRRSQSMTLAKTNGTTTTTTTTTTATMRDENDRKVGGKDRRSFKSTKLEQQRLQDDDEDDEDERITPEDLAPDGGWGWMVALAMILVFITTIGPASSFAIVFGDFLEDTGQAGAATTLFNSVFMVTFSIAGLLTNALMKKYSMRPVGVVGAIFFAFPNVALAFVNDVYEMAFIFFIQGIGLGLMVTICNTNFNAYFVKKRSQVMSAAQVIIGLGGIVYPILLEKAMRIYGFRGTAALTGALSLNCIVGMTMMHPVEWHARKPSEVRAERARQRQERKLREKSLTNRRSTFDVIHVSSKAKWSSLRSLKEETGKDVPLLIETLKAPHTRVSSITDIETGIRARSKSGSMREPLTRRISTLSASSLANIVTALGAARQLHLDNGTKCQLEENGEKQEDSVLASLAKLFEVSLLKDKCFLNMCVGVSFVLSSDFIFSSLLPLMMTNAGYTKSDAALAITVGATAELVSRILLAVFTLLVDVKAKYLFFAAMNCMAVAKIAFMCYEGTLIGTIVMIAAIGVVRSWLLVPQPLVIIEDLSINKFAAAYGIFAVISGIISIVFGPIVGFIKDWTDSFTLFQMSLLFMNVLFVVPWGIQFLVVDLPKRRKDRAKKSAAHDANSFSTD